jgi:hypothetical protein
VIRRRAEDKPAEAQAPEIQSSGGKAGEA